MTVSLLYCRTVSRSVVSDSVTLWNRAHQAALSMGVLQARTLERVAISFSSDLPNPGIEPGSPASQEDSLPTGPPEKPIAGFGHISLKPHFLTLSGKSAQF